MTVLGAYFFPYYFLVKVGCEENVVFAFLSKELVRLCSDCFYSYLEGSVGRLFLTIGLSFCFGVSFEIVLRYLEDIFCLATYFIVSKAFTLLLTTFLFFSS